MTEPAAHTDEVVARHVSADGRLAWRVERWVNPDGTVDGAAGFEGGLWHVHPDQLKREGEPIAKLLAVTGELLSDRLLIVEETWPVPDQPGEIGPERWPLVDLDFDLSMKSNDETWRLRFWSGRMVTIEDLIDGKVDYLPLDQKYFADD